VPCLSEGKTSPHRHQHNTRSILASPPSAHYTSHCTSRCCVAINSLIFLRSFSCGPHSTQHTAQTERAGARPRPQPAGRRAARSRSGRAPRQQTARPPARRENSRPPPSSAQRLAHSAKRRPGPQRAWAPVLVRQTTSQVAPYYIIGVDNAQAAPS
jgi:hypothetical protein